MIPVRWRGIRRLPVFRARRVRRKLSVQPQSGLWTEWHFLQSDAAFQLTKAPGALFAKATAAS